MYQKKFNLRNFAGLFIAKHLRMFHSRIDMI